MRPDGAFLDENVQNLRDRYLQSVHLPLLLFELPVDLKLSLQLNLKSRQIVNKCVHTGYASFIKNIDLLNTLN